MVHKNKQQEMKNF